MMLTVGLNRIRTLLSNNITTGIVGTGTTSALTSDADLEVSVSSTSATLTNTTTGTKYLSMSHEIGYSESGTLSEIGFKGSTGTLYIRSVYPSISKTTTNKLTYRKKIFVDGS